jgi:hypothetical protein
LNIRDEGWPVYAPCSCTGGTSRRRALVFPPDTCAGFGAWPDLPGIEITRVIYAAFSVALVVAMYVLAGA